jgi:hypothetical protein
VKCVTSDDANEEDNNLGNDQQGRNVFEPPYEKSVGDMRWTRFLIVDAILERFAVKANPISESRRFDGLKTATLR